MILIRSAYDGRSIESELIQRDIPYKFIGGTSLLKSAHVRDVLSLLRIVHNSKDDLAWIRYMQLWDGIGVKKAQKISSIMFNTTKEEAIVESESIIGKEHKALKTYLEILKVFSDPKKCINAAIMKLTPLLEDRYDHWDKRKNDLEVIRMMAGRYDSVSDFIDDFTLEPLQNS